MLSHQVGAAQYLEVRALTEARSRIKSLKLNLDEQQAAHQCEVEQLDKTIEALGPRAREADTLAQRLAETEAELAAWRSGERTQALESALQESARELDKAQQKISHQAGRIQALEEHLTLEHDQQQSLAARYRQLEQDYLHLEGILLESDAQEDPKDPAQSQPRVDLGGRRVLYIGGRTHLVARYRNLVNRCNGEFIHHDGGREENSPRLDQLIGQADAVVCPLDCTSHDAARRCKLSCKSQCKAYLMLKSSGVSSFARALSKLAGPGASEGSNATT